MNAGVFILGVISSSLIVEIFKAIREDIKEKKKETKEQADVATKKDLEPLQEGIKELLGESLDSKLKEWASSEVRTSEMWDEIEEFYKPYKKLKGNGTRQKRYEECKKIPITE